jgi:hypothetical protein
MLWQFCAHMNAAAAADVIVATAPDERPAVRCWPALLRLLDRKDDSYKL